MNQILYMNNSRKNKEPMEIKTVLKIFSIAAIVFGIILIGQGSYGMINKKEDMTATIPLVTINQEGNKLILNINHDKIIENIIYSWNENQDIVLQGKGRTQIEEKIDLPMGTNILKLKVTDINGKTVTYSESYELTDSDVTKPEIELLVENSKVKIVVKDETGLNYMTYYWNNEDETRIDAKEESSKQIEEKISILKGENTLTIVAVDKAGNETVKEQTFKGAKKPTIELARDGKELIITVKDEEEIKKVEYTLNGQFYSTDPQNTGTSLNMKEFMIRQPLQEGSNLIIIKAYNINDLEEEISGETTI